MKIKKNKMVVDLKKLKRRLRFVVLGEIVG